MTQCHTGDHEPSVRGHLLLNQPRPLNTAAGCGPLRVRRKEKKLRINTILGRAANRKDAGLHGGQSGAPAPSAFVPRDQRVDFGCWGSFGKSPAGGRRAEVLPGPRSPAPALARDSLRPVSAGDRHPGARGTAPGARDKTEARRVAAPGSAAAAAPRAHGDRAGSLGNWSWPGRVPRLPALFPGRRNSQVRRPSLPGIGR